MLNLALITSNTCQAGHIEPVLNHTVCAASAPLISLELREKIFFASLLCVGITSSAGNKSFLYLAGRIPDGNQANQTLTLSHCTSKGATANANTQRGVEYHQLNSLELDNP